MVTLRSTRSVLSATAFLFALSIIVMRATFTWLEYHDTVNRAEASTRDMAHILEEYAKRTFETSDLIADKVTAYINDHGGVEALRGSLAGHRFLADLATRTDVADYLMVVDARGIPIALSNQYPVIPVDLSDREWWQQHAKFGTDSYIGEALQSRIANELLFTYSKRILDKNGELAGAIQISMRPTFFNDIPLTQNNTGQGTALGMFGQDDGRIIARTNLPLSQIGGSIAHSPLFASYTSMREGTYRGLSVVDSGEKIVSFRRLENWPLIVTASVPVPIALAAWYRNLYWSLAILAVVLSGLAWLTWFGFKLSYREKLTRDKLSNANEKLSAALVEKEVLLKEIHHRVKNNLQVTSSLLHMQAGRFKDPQVQEAFQEAQDRLRSISLLHETLYSKDMVGHVNLAEYLERLVEKLAATYGADQRKIAIQLDLQPVTIDLDRAVPLALSLTEAISNAFKHAFSPEQEGCIAVSVHQIEGTLEVTVRDTGKGMPAEYNDRSLGMRLINALAAQLNGRVSLENDNGTVYRLAIPAVA